MSYLIFDVETTDVYNKNIPLDDPKQARIVQLAAIVLDTEFKEMASFSTLIRPDSWVITPGAQAAHKIDMSSCIDYGIYTGHALAVFAEMVYNSTIQVAHNISFDSKLIEIEQTLLGCPSIDFINKVCTMHLMTDICKLPTKYPGGKYKWPKLIEAYRHVTGQDFDKQHGALADVRACATVFKWLVKQDKVTLPKADISDCVILDILGNVVK